MTDVNKITWDDVGTAHDASRTLLQIAKSHPPSICMGALIMATSLAARDMNIPPESVAAMLDSMITQVYASTGAAHLATTVN